MMAPIRSPHSYRSYSQSVPALAAYYVSHMHTLHSSRCLSWRTPPEEAGARTAHPSPLTMATRHRRSQRSPRRRPPRFCPPRRKGIPIWKSGSCFLARASRRCPQTAVHISAIEHQVELAQKSAFQKHLRATIACSLLPGQGLRPDAAAAAEEEEHDA